MSPTPIHNSVSRFSDVMMRLNKTQSEIEPDEGPSPSTAAEFEANFAPYATALRNFLKQAGEGGFTQIGLLPEDVAAYAPMTPKPPGPVQ